MSKNQGEVPRQTLCIVNNIPSPYRRALFDELEHQATEKAIKFSVLYLTKTEQVRSWKVQIRDFETILPVLWQSRNIRTPTSDFIINFQYLRKTLFPSHVLLFGYNYVTYVIVAVIRSICLRKTFLFCETTLIESASPNWKARIKSLFFRAFFYKFIVPGKRSADYLIRHGVPRHKIHFACNASPLTPLNPPDIQERNSLRLLFVGRLAPEKNIVNFVSVFSKLETRHQLTIVGDGPATNEIEEISQHHPNIRLLGSVDTHELHDIYSQNDVLILVSKGEPWGMVVNEAINFGLALILSPEVGSSPELLDGNGKYLNEITPNNLDRVLEDVTKNITILQNKSLHIASKITPKSQATQILSILRQS